MRGLLRTGDMKGAMSVYEEMSELLLAHFGVMPSGDAAHAVSSGDTHRKRPHTDHGRGLLSA